MAKKGNVKKPRAGAGKNNGYRMKAMVGTIAILAACIVVFFIADLLSPFRRGPGMDSDYMFLRIILSLLIIVFSVFLTYVYLRDYLELKNELTLAILLAIVSFLMFGLSSNPAVFMMFGVHPSKMGVFSIIPFIFATISLGILAWISNK